MRNTHRSKYRTVRYRFATSALFGVLVAVAIAVAGNENVRHHTGQAVPVTGTATAGALAAVLMFGIWSILAMSRASARRAADRAREAERAERERLNSRRGGRRYAGSPR
jgi:type VI protein secretion system component VasK